MLDWIMCTLLQYTPLSTSKRSLQSGIVYFKTTYQGKINRVEPFSIFFSRCANFRFTSQKLIILDEIS